METRTQSRMLFSHYFAKGKIFSDEENYKVAIEFLIKAGEENLKFSDRSDSDNRNLSSVQHYLGDCYFNLKEFDMAALYYQGGVLALLNLGDKADDDYRAILKLQINLLDSFSELNNSENIKRCMMNIVTSFTQIKNHTAQELEIGDPEQNFQKLKTHFDIELSSKKYLESPQFQNHQTIVDKIQKDMNDNDVSILAEKFSSILGNSNAPQVITQTQIVPINDFISEDEDYRCYSDLLVNVANNHTNLHNKLVTIEQSLASLNSIKEKKTKDEENINALNKYIEELKSIINAEHQQAQIQQIGLTLAIQNQNIQTSLDGIFGLRQQYQQSLHYLNNTNTAQQTPEERSDNKMEI